MSGKVSISIEDAFGIIVGPFEIDLLEPFDSNSESGPEAKLTRASQCIDAIIAAFTGKYFHRHILLENLSFAAFPNEGVVAQVKHYLDQKGINI